MMNDSNISKAIWQRQQAPKGFREEELEDEERAEELWLEEMRQSHTLSGAFVGRKE